MQPILNYGILPWNTSAKHYRKFMEAEGEYFSANMACSQTSILRFWGEWEPESLYYRLSGTSPKYLHFPILLYPQPAVGMSSVSSCSHSGNGMVCTLGNHRQNTDPFVFADSFFYSVCHQMSAKGKPTNLTKLAPGSIILFGTKVKTGFALDTVFVVKDSMPYTSAITQPGYVPSVYPGIMQIPPTNGLICYKGASFVNRQNEMYSFAPCRISNGSNKGFKRPILSASIFQSIHLAILTDAQTQNWKKTDLTYNQVRQIWDCVRNTIQNQGYLEGFNFKYNVVKKMP